MPEAFSFEHDKLLSGAVSRTARRWFTAVQCELPDSLASPIPASTTGVDVGACEHVLFDARCDLPCAPRPSRASHRANVTRLHTTVANALADFTRSPPISRTITARS